MVVRHGGGFLRALESLVETWDIGGGGGAQAVTLDEALIVAEPGRDLVALDEALDALAKMDQRKAKVVEMRFFGGLSVEETADAMSISPATVKRHWAIAKAWLLREIEGVHPR